MIISTWLKSVLLFQSSLASPFQIEKRFTQNTLNRYKCHEEGVDSIDRITSSMFSAPETFARNTFYFQSKWSYLHNNYVLGNSGGNPVTASFSLTGKLFDSSNVDADPIQNIPSTAVYSTSTALKLDDKSKYKVKTLSKYLSFCPEKKKLLNKILIVLDNLIGVTPSRVSTLSTFFKAEEICDYSRARPISQADVNSFVKLLSSSKCRNPADVVCKAEFKRTSQNLYANQFMYVYSQYNLHDDDEYHADKASIMLLLPDASNSCDAFFFQYEIDKYSFDKRCQFGTGEQ